MYDNNVNFRFFDDSASTWASQGMIVVKNPPANAGDMRDVGLIPGLGRSPGGGHGNPVQYSCPLNPRRGLTLLSPVCRDPAIGV